MRSIFNHIRILINLYPKTVSYFTVVLIFLPTLLKGSFYGDDWGFLYVAKSENYDFISIFRNHWPVLGYRPIADFVLSVTSAIFRQNFFLFTLLNISVLYVALCIILHQLLHRYLDLVPKVVIPYIGTLGVLPFFVTTVVFSSLTHLVTSISVLLFGISLKMHISYYEKSENKYLYISGILVLAALLNYEIFLPLLSIHFFITFKEYLERKKNILKNWSPILFLLLMLGLGFFYQKYLATIVGATDYNRVALTTPTVLARETIVRVHDFIVLVFQDLFRHTLEAGRIGVRSEITLGLAVFASTLIALGSFATVSKAAKMKRQSDRGTIANLFMIAILVFVASAFLAGLSGAEISLGGYVNRYLFGLWISLYLVVVVLIVYSRKTRFLSIFSFIGIFVLVLTFMVSQGKFLVASKLRIEIQNRIQTDLEMVDASDIVIIADIPQCAPGAFLNEEIFTMSWDFDGMLKLQDSNKVFRSTNVQLRNHLYAPWYNINSDRLVLFGWWELKRTDIGNVYLYRYDTGLKESYLVKARDWEHIVNFTSSNQLVKNHFCKSDLESYRKASGDLRSFLSNYLKD